MAKKMATNSKAEKNQKTCVYKRLAWLKAVRNNAGVLFRFRLKLLTFLSITHLPLSATQCHALVTSNNAEGKVP